MIKKKILVTYSRLITIFTISMIAVNIGMMSNLIKVTVVLSENSSLQCLIRTSLTNLCNRVLIRFVEIYRHKESKVHKKLFDLRKRCWKLKRLFRDLHILQQRQIWKSFLLNQVNSVVCKEPEMLLNTNLCTILVVEEIWNVSMKTTSFICSSFNLLVQ